ncbi:hypothetical protein HCU64_16145 [Methylobacterium sp. C25]|nr:hypothetical protein [Methylobacterium sp. C25]
MRGGLLGLRDGISVVGPILTSVGAGASVGIEAAVTQVGATLASLFGQAQRLPRSEMRILVGSGAAAAIGAAYGAPLAGALYAFELILGEYSTRMLASVGLAAVAGSAMSSAALGHGSTFQFPPISQVDGTSFLVAVLVGSLCALLGIATMVLTSECERGLRRLLKSPLSRFAAGAAVLAGLAVAAPGVLGSGHAGIVDTVGGRIVGTAALGLLFAKIGAASISLGVGFRGGLFSASLLIGALTGSVVAYGSSLVPSLPQLDSSLCIAIGMASAGASIIGSPLAMIFLVLETGASLDATAAVAVGAIVASFLTGRLFGYSFATWRFQLRGLGIEGGRDVSRFSALSIRSLVRPPKQTLDAEAGIEEVLRAVSVAGSRGTAVKGRDGRFIGLIDPDLVEIASVERSLPVVATDLICNPPVNVSEFASLAEILDLFRKDDRATVAVIDSIDSRKLIGCVRARDAYASAAHVPD